MKGTSLMQLLQTMFPELLNRIIAQGSISLSISWNGQEFNATINSDPKAKHD